MITTETTSKPPSPPILELAARDIYRVLEEQREQRQILTTQLNILFVTNGALLTILTISRLILSASPFSVAELLGFLANFTLLLNALLPRQVAVTPNLQDRSLLENYLSLPSDQYQIQMLANLIESYNANKQRVDDISQSLLYAAYTTWGIVLLALSHIAVAQFWVMGNG